MQTLIYKIQQLQQSPINKKINQRLTEFSSFKNKSSEDWFSELCFCLLTANAKAKTALTVQQELGFSGFSTLSVSELTKTLLDNKHRFHNTKARFIIDARQYIEIKNIMINIIKQEDIKQKNKGKEEHEAREWLVQNVKGFGYKESSHFLRNVGYQNVAILDRHILNILFQYKIIKNIPKTLTRKKYLAIEKKMETLADAVSMTQAELDLYLWHMKTGEVLK